MVRNNLVSAVALLLLIACLSSCVPLVIPSEHDYVLIRSEGGDLTVVEDDAPLYERFESEVLSDPFARRLLTLYAHATEAFVATNTRTNHAQAVANHPLIVVDSAKAGVLRDLRVSHGTRRIPVELALGVGEGGSENLALARKELPLVVGPLLFELMGLDPEGCVTSARPALYEATTPSCALWIGFGASLAALHGETQPRLAQRNPDLSAASQDGHERLYRYHLVPANGFRYRFEDGLATSQLRSDDVAQRTPGVVATFLYRLLKRADSFYPQREMLWFVNYDAEEWAYGKVLLAVQRMATQREASVEAFVAVYAETFPAERGLVHDLAHEVFGSTALGEWNGAAELRRR